MSSELFSIKPFAAGGKGDFSRKDIIMATMAVRRFNLTDEIREEMLTWGRLILNNSHQEKTQLAALKMLIEMDKCDVARERNDKEPSGTAAVAVIINVVEQVVVKADDPPMQIIEAVVSNSNG